MLTCSLAPSIGNLKIWTAATAIRSICSKYEQCSRLVCNACRSEQHSLRGEFPWSALQGRHAIMACDGAMRWILLGHPSRSALVLFYRFATTSLSTFIEHSNLTERARGAPHRRYIYLVPPQTPKAAIMQQRQARCRASNPVTVCTAAEPKKILMLGAPPLPLFCTWIRWGTVRD